MYNIGKYHILIRSSFMKTIKGLLFDIKGAMDAGLRAALVKTDKFQPENRDKRIQPDVILPDVTALPSVLM